jgi:hypothetical protein
MILSAFEEFSYWKQKVINTSGLQKTSFAKNLPDYSLATA